MTPRQIPERIVRRLVPEPNTGCLLWEGPQADNGYGVVWFEGRRQRVHCVVFQCVKGRRKRRDRQLLHKCDTRQCAEPTHLREGTQSQNMRDMVSKGRAGGFVRRALLRAAVQS